MFIFRRGPTRAAPGWDKQPTPDTRGFGIDTQKMKEEVEREAMQSILAEIDVDDLKAQIIKSAVDQLDFDKLAWAIINQIHDQPSLISALNAQKEPFKT